MEVYFIIERCWNGSENYFRVKLEINGEIVDCYNKAYNYKNAIKCLRADNNLQHKKAKYCYL